MSNLRPYSRPAEADALRWMSHVLGDSTAQLRATSCHKIYHKVNLWDLERLVKNMPEASIVAVG